jgi:hypothetical protein
MEDSCPLQDAHSLTHPLNTVVEKHPCKVVPGPRLIDLGNDLGCNLVTIA